MGGWGITKKITSEVKTKLERRRTTTKIQKKDLGQSAYRGYTKILHTDNKISEEEEPNAGQQNTSMKIKKKKILKI